MGLIGLDDRHSAMLFNVGRVDKRYNAGNCRDMPRFQIKSGMTGVGGGWASCAAFGLTPQPGQRG